MCVMTFSLNVLSFLPSTYNVSTLATFIELTKLLPNVNQEQRN
jgi:hypothetical protein